MAYTRVTPATRPSELPTLHGFTPAPSSRPVPSYTVTNGGSPSYPIEKHPLWCLYLDGQVLPIDTRGWKRRLRRWSAACNITSTGADRSPQNWGCRHPSSFCHELSVVTDHPQSLSRRVGAQPGWAQRRKLQPGLAPFLAALGISWDLTPARPLRPTSILRRASRNSCSPSSTRMF